MTSRPFHGDRPSTGTPDAIATRKQFAEALTRLRERSGLTVRDVAKATGIPYSTVGGYMSGRHLPPVSEPEILRSIVRACGVVDDQEIEGWWQTLLRLRRLPGPRPADAPAPYKGLATYEPGDSEWFFGRQELTRTVMQRLAEAWAAGSGPVAVLGPSGCGKSSLLRAGVIGALRKGGRGADGSGERRTLLFTPGKSPLSAFAAALAAATDSNIDNVDAALRGDASSCVALLRAGMEATSGGSEPACVVVVDQCEEVFTECTDDAERQAFFTALHACSTSGPDHCPPVGEDGRPAAAVIFALRADFYHRALREPRLVPVLQHAQVPVGPMSEVELREAILGPAHKAGLDVEDGFVELLLRDMAPAVGTQGADAAHEAGALPLLSHTLRVMWERAARRRLTVADYQAVGGVRGALALTADDVLDSLPQAGRRLARELFVRLVRVQEDGPNTRRRLSLQDLDSLTDATQRDTLGEVVERFVAQRLIMVDADSIQLAHEALVVAWPRLRSWIEADRRELLVRQQIGDAAQQWHREGRDLALLYRGARLSAAQELVDAHGAQGLGDLAREFLKESSRRERRRVRTLYQTVAALTALLLVAVTGGVAAIVQRGEAVRQRTLATEERNAALSRLVAIRADRLRETDPALAAQLALAAYRITQTTEARSSLLNASATPEVTRMISAEAPLLAFALSSVDGLLASVGAGGGVRLWNITDPDRPTIASEGLPDMVGDVSSLAFHPRQPLLAAGGSEGVSLYDVSDPTAPLALDARLAYAVDRLAFSADGAVLTATTADGGVRLWDYSNPAGPDELDLPFAGPVDAYSVAALSPNGTVLAAVGGDRRVYLWDLTHPAAPVLLAEPLTGPTLSVFRLAFSPDGRTLAAASADRRVYLWDLTNLAEPKPYLEPLSGPANWVHTVAFSPDGLNVAAGSSDGLAWLWRLDTGAVVTTMPHPGPVIELAFDADGRSLFTGAADGVVRRFPVPGPVLSEPINTVHDLAWHADLLVAASGDGAVYLWDTSDPQRPVSTTAPLTSPRSDSPLVGTTAISPDGRMLVASGLDGSVWRWDISDPSRPVILDPPLTDLTRFAESLAFGADGRLLAAGGSDGTIALWDVADPRRPVLVTTFDDATRNVYSVAFSPDGRTLAAGGFETAVWLWDISDPTDPVPLGEPLTGPTNFVYSIAFHPAGDTIAVGSADGTVRLWDITDRTRPMAGPVLTGPNGYVIGIAFSPDGNRLATSSTDHAVWLWDSSDLASPTTYAVLTGPDGPVQDVAYRFDSRAVAASSQDTNVRIWHTEPEEVTERLCAVAGDQITRDEWEQHVPDLPYHRPCATPPTMVEIVGGILS